MVHMDYKTLCATCVVWLLTLNVVSPVAAEVQILRRGGAGDPETFDPHKFISAFEGTILTDLFMGLTVNSPDDKPLPGAATSWTFSDDGLTMTFDMRDGITWSDGTPLTAEDFVYSFHRIANPETASSSVALLSPIFNAQKISRGELPVDQLGVEAPDPDTLIVRLEHPAPYLLEILSFIGLPVPQHTLEEHGSAWIRPENIVVNGPYVLKEWVASSHIRLVKNENFYDADNLFFDEVFHVPSEDLRAGLIRFRSGDLDTLVSFPQDQLPIIEEEMPDALRIGPSLSVETYIFNTQAPPFDDARVRRALSMAIDRETLTDRVLRTGEKPAYSYIPPTALNYPKRAEADFKDVPYAERLETAKALLADAGFGPDNPLQVPLRYNTQEAQLRIASAIAAMWRRIGVETELINTERRVLAADRYQGNFEAARYLRASATYDPSFWLLNLQSELSNLNLTQYHSDTYNALFNKGWYSLDMAERAAFFYEAEAYAVADQPIIPLYFGLTRRLVKPEIEGWVDNPRGIHPSRWLSRKAN